MEYIDLQPGKPQCLALSFSGGGFRAALYSLGCLAYLYELKVEQLPLLEKVRFISSASGGSITNLAYVRSRRKTQPFPSFFNDLLDKLEGRKLLDEMFKVMEEKTVWKERPHKSKNLINAFAVVYDRILFDEQNFSVFQSGGALPPAEICVNSTEFDNAMLFRFQNAGKAGNQFLYFNNEAVLGKIKLGDILAASSCFTVGFEPIVFPDDFSHSTLSPETLRNCITADTRFSPEKGDAGAKPLCFDLMDGGIDDNQGIGSFMLAEQRLQTVNGKGYDLYLTCDVSSNYTSGYEFPAEKKKPYLLPSVRQYLLGVFIIFAASLTFIIMRKFTGAAYFFLGMSFLVLLVAATVRIVISRAYRKSLRNRETFGPVILGKLGLFLKLRLGILLQMIASRGSSAAYLAGVVFLKKIRRISYDRLFEKVSETRNIAEDGTESIQVKHWSKYSVQNALYFLSTKNRHQRLADLKKEKWYRSRMSSEEPLVAYEPSPALLQVIDTASSMDTTLWFDEHHMKDDQPRALATAGAATTCYNLLRWAMRFDSNDPYWHQLQNQLSRDWQLFQSDPHWLHRKLSAFER